MPGKRAQIRMKFRPSIGRQPQRSKIKAPPGYALISAEQAGKMPAEQIAKPLFLSPGDAKRLWAKSMSELSDTQALALDWTMHKVPANSALDHIATFEKRKGTPYFANWAVRTKLELAKKQYFNFARRVLGDFSKKTPEGYLVNRIAIIGWAFPGSELNALQKAVKNGVTKQKAMQIVQEMKRFAEELKKPVWKKRFSLWLDDHENQSVDVGLMKRIRNVENALRKMKK